MRKEIGDIHGILVTGDVAYSGMEKEYDTALNWLEKLSKIVGCEKQNIWVTPGNHDVDRSVVDNSKILKDQHKLFRETNPQSLDSEIEATFKDEISSKLLFEPIKTYIKFASKYSCEISASKPTWMDVLSLNDGSKLILNGLNSTLTSDRYDDDKANKLFLGAHQTIMVETQDNIHMTLCHHPPDWLIDKDHVQKNLLSKVRIQLFGHKHFQTVLQVKNEEDIDTLQIVSGAVHPERKELTWCPCYNYISLRIDDEQAKRTLKVLVYQRQWEKTSFQAASHLKGSIYKEYSLDLVSSKIKLQNKKQESDPGEKNLMEAGKAQQKGQSKKHTKRELAYKFLILPHHTIMKIIVKLELFEEQDENLMNFEIFKKIFKRAENKGITHELWSAVLNEHGEEFKGY